MKKAIIVIVILSLLGVGAFFGYRQYTTTQQEKARIAAEQRLERANQSYADLEEEAKTWRIGEDIELKTFRIERRIEKLINNYPDLEVSEKAETFREVYPEIISEGYEQAKKATAEAEEKAAKDKAEKEAKELAEAEQFFIEIGETSTDPVYWYNFFTTEEKQRLYNNEVKIGDREQLVLFLNGYYEKKTSETAVSKNSNYYGKSGARYDLISARNGLIDYIAQ